MSEFNLKLDLGCGQNKKEGYIGVDIADIPGVDVVHNLEVFPWPFADDSVDDVFSSHYIEHVDNIMGFMNELYRVMKPGAKGYFIAPYGQSNRAWQDPTHKRPILSESFLYYNKKWRDDNKLDHYPIKCDFEFTYGFQLNPYWANRAKEVTDHWLLYGVNVASDIHVTLTKRAPG